MFGEAGERLVRLVILDLVGMIDFGQIGWLGSSWTYTIKKYSIFFGLVGFGRDKSLGWLE